MKRDVIANNPTRFEVGPIYSGKVSFFLRPLSFWVCNPLEAKDWEFDPVAQGQEDADEERFQTDGEGVGV